MFHSDRKWAREVFKKLPGGGTLHSDRIWAHGEPWGPHSRSFIEISGTDVVSATPQTPFCFFLLVRGGLRIPATAVDAMAV